MPKCLTPAQIEQYREEGCVFPIPIMSETEAAEFRGRLEAFERRTGGPPGSLTGGGGRLVILNGNATEFGTLSPSAVSTPRPGAKLRI